jgi:hypothetical protein
MKNHLKAKNVKLKKPKRSGKMRNGSHALYGIYNKTPNRLISKRT